MKIISAVRTRNEAANIDRFCRCYAWADVILVADGGSEDDTIQRAKQYQNVRVELFTERAECNGVWRNPHGKHINFLIDWAIAEGADWIIFDDCDCVPTKDLQNSARNLLEITSKPAVCLYRLYIWGKNHYFPELNDPGQSLWAWRKEANIRADESDPLTHHLGEWKEQLDLWPPYCALHYYCPDEATVQQKLTFYNQLKGQECKHPLEIGGELKPLPEWATI